MATGASLAARQQGRVAGTAGKLAAHRAFLVEVVQAEPDITLKELAGALLEAEGVQANIFFSVSGEPAPWFRLDVSSGIPSCN